MIADMFNKAPDIALIASVPFVMIMALILFILTFPLSLVLFMASVPFPELSENKTLMELPISIMTFSMVYPMVVDIELEHRDKKRNTITYDMIVKQMNQD